MATETPVFDSTGKILLGTRVTQEAEWEEHRDVTGTLHRFKTREASSFFVPTKASDE
jgi:hypothetical protein